MRCVCVDVAYPGGFSPHCGVLWVGGFDGRRSVVGVLLRARVGGPLGSLRLRLGVLGRGDVSDAGMETNLAVVGPAELEFGSEHVDVDDVERAPIDGPVLMWVGLGLVGGGPVVGELDGGEAWGAPRISDSG